MGTDASGTGSGSNQTGTSGTGMSGGSAGGATSAGTYPPCSRTVTDSCIQTNERGKRRSRRR
jgi:hypothetical protein